MISTSRCNGRGVCTVVMPKPDCRMVNGGGGVGGCVNRCEQALDDKNEMVMATSETSVDGEQIMATAAKNGIYPSSDSSEMVSLKEYAYTNLMMIDEYKAEIEEKDEKINQLSKEVDYLKHKLDEATKHLNEIAARDEALDVLPFTPVSSTCSSGMGDLSSAELHEQQEVKVRKRRNRPAVGKTPNPDPLEPSQTKQRKTRNTRTKSNDLDKIQEFSLITTDNAYYTCLGNYDPIKDEPVPEKTNSNLEIPSWRVKQYSSRYSMEGTENMSDEVFHERHVRLENNERKRKKWDAQRLRELRQIESLKKGRKKHHSQKSNDKDKHELITLLPNPDNIEAIEITENIPVSAFGSNLHIKKKLELFKFSHSQWCNDGSKIPQDHNNVRGLRSSGRVQIFETM